MRSHADEHAAPMKLASAGWPAPPSGPAPALAEAPSGARQLAEIRPALETVLPATARSMRKTAHAGTTAATARAAMVEHVQTMTVAPQHY